MDRPQLTCPCCGAVFSTSTTTIPSSQSSYVIDDLPSLDGVSTRQSVRGVFSPSLSTSQRPAAAARDGDGAAEEEDTLSQACVPRQLPVCGHVVCTACAIVSFIECGEEARFDPTDVTAAPVIHTRGSLSTNQFARYFRMRDPLVSSVQCPILTCQVHSPLPDGTVAGLPVMHTVGQLAAVSRIQWGVADGEPVATEWHEPIVDTSAEEIAAAMIASTDCLAHLRGDCVTEAGEPCAFRHPPDSVINKGNICREWVKTNKCRVGCRSLHPSAGLISRTDCLASVHPRLFCNGRRHGLPCPFRHDDPLGRYRLRAPNCPKWPDYACNDVNCSFVHQYQRPAPTGKTSRARAVKKGNVGVFWDMLSCPIPAAGWPYGVGMAFDRLLRKAGYFTTGPGWRLHFTCYGQAVPPETIAQLSTARATVKDTLPDPEDTSAKLSNTGVSANVDADILEFVRKYKTSGVACILVASSSPKLIATIQRLTHKDVHVVLAVPNVTTASPELISSATEALGVGDIFLMAHPSPPPDLLAKAAAMRPKKVFAPSPDGPPRCPNFRPALQMGCPSGDSCVYFHEKRPCRTMLMSVADCPFGNDCLLRHVPLSTPDAKLAYKEVAVGVRGVPMAATGVSWGKRGVRKLYSMPRHDGSKYNDVTPETVTQQVYSGLQALCTHHPKRFLFSQHFVPPPGYWTCCMCTFKFNPPLKTEGATAEPDPLGSAVPVVDVKDTPCQHCGAPYADAACYPNRPKQEKPTLKGCWFCPVCLFGGNTIGKELSCQVCSSPGGDRARGLPRLFYCPECKHLNDENVAQCDFCKTPKPAAWSIKFAVTISAEDS